MNSVGGVDPRFVGKCFTWSNGQEGLALIIQRLDRVIANKLWLGVFPQANVEHLCQKSALFF